MRGRALRRSLELDPTGGVFVAVRPEGGCTGCRARGGCGLRFPAAESHHRMVRLPVPERWYEHALGGFRFEARLPAAALLRMTCVVFVGLAALLVAGAWLGSALWGGGDGAAAVGVLLALGVGCALLRRYDSHLRVRPEISRGLIVPTDRGC